MAAAWTPPEETAEAPGVVGPTGPLPLRRLSSPLIGERGEGQQATAQPPGGTDALLHGAAQRSRVGDVQRALERHHLMRQRLARVLPLVRHLPLAGRDRAVHLIDARDGVRFA